MLTGRADTGGGPEHLYQLTRELLDSCHVSIAAPPEKPYWDRFTALVGASRMFALPHRSFSLRALRQLDRWCEENHIAIVHSHGRAAGAYSRLLTRGGARACVHTPHGSLQLKSPKDFVYWAADFVLARRTDRTIAVSASEARQLRRLLALRDSLAVIPNGVVIPDRAAPPPFENAPLRIVHVTRFVPQKNSGAVIDILVRLKQRGQLHRFHVDVLGDGPGAFEFLQTARFHGVHPHLTLHGAQPSIAPFLLRSTAFLSTSRWEGLPLAVLEALAHGVPVIASDVAGNHDVVSNEVGRLFPLHEPDAAAQQIIAVGTEPALWGQLAQAARRLIQERYSVARMARETLEVYLEACAPRAQPIREAA